MLEFPARRCAILLDECIIGCRNSVADDLGTIASTALAGIEGLGSQLRNIAVRGIDRARGRKVTVGSHGTAPFTAAADDGHEAIGALDDRRTVEFYAGPLCAWHPRRIGDAGIPAVVAGQCLGRGKSASVRRRHEHALYR